MFSKLSIAYQVSTVQSLWINQNSVNNVWWECALIKFASRSHRVSLSAAPNRRLYGRNTANSNTIRGISWSRCCRYGEWITTTLTNTKEQQKHTDQTIKWLWTSSNEPLQFKYSLCKIEYRYRWLRLLLNIAQEHTADKHTTLDSYRTYVRRSIGI